MYVVHIKEQCKFIQEKVNFLYLSGKETAQVQVYLF